MMRGIRPTTGGREPSHSKSAGHGGDGGQISAYTIPLDLQGPLIQLGFTLKQPLPT